jgi:hypothetical protein
MPLTNPSQARRKPNLFHRSLYREVRERPWAAMTRVGLSQSDATLRGARTAAENLRLDRQRNATVRMFPHATQ